ncbi:MAG: CARDB domain-containing protein [Planctomycetota bacterium]
MQTKRDNLVLIGAFAVAIALHAAVLPWVGTAVGESDAAQIDLIVESFDADHFAKAGDMLGTFARVVELEDGTSTHLTRFDRTDKIWLSRDRFINDDDEPLFDLIIPGVLIQDPKRVSVEALNPSVQVVADADGLYWIIYQADVDQQVPDPDRSNNTRVAPIYIDGPQRPELAVQAFNTPDRAAAGGSVLIDFAIDNIGDGWASSNPQLGEHGWADRVYLSTDDQLDATDLPLRTFERTAPLGPEGGYRHDAVELELPRGVSGAMHLILVADADQVLDQPSFTRGFKAVPIDLIDTDEPDLVVAAITNPPPLVIGRPSPIAFSVANLGSVPTVNSSWLDGVYLSRTRSLDDTAILLTQVNAGQPLQPRSRYETAVELTLAPDEPSIEPGPWYLVVRADDDKTINEAVFEDNNTFAVPVDVLTPEQADAEIKLGDPDRPDRLVVQWIEHDRIEEHIALRSRTVQPAIQSEADPDPNAPLVDNPLPPALAAADTATGDPSRPTPLTDPTDPDTNQPPPDATATDVAPRPQAPSSPTQSKIDGLPGDAGTLPPRRDGIDRPTTPNLPIDPTPGPNDTPTPAPGEREVPSPEDPNAPDTDTTTDSETPAETESDNDSDNPEKTDTDVTTDNPPEDTTTTPKPDVEESPKPEGDDGDPATPSEEQSPTRAPKDDSEAPPTDIKITELELQEGQVLVGKGIKITTKLPTPPGTGSRVLSIPRNARVSITFDNQGKVYKAEVIRTTTYKEWDAAIEASLYRWTARGEAIDKAQPHVTIEWDYLLNDLFDDDN